jgi:hypothetical protein
MLDILSQRQPRIFRTRIHYTDVEIQQRYRLTRLQMAKVLSKIGPDLKRITLRNHALGVEKVLTVALRQLATGAGYRVCGDSEGKNFFYEKPFIDIDHLGVSKSTAAMCLKVVVKSLVKHWSDVLKFPTTTNGRLFDEHEFWKVAGISGVCGIIDGTHIEVTVSKEMNPIFYTGRKKKTTVNVVSVCDAHGRFNFVSVNWPGPVHDSRTFSRTVLYKSFCRGWRPFKGAFLIADKGYKNEDFIVAIKKAKKGRKQFYK